jgi:uncharacterized protein (TIGR01244 family)
LVKGEEWNWLWESALDTATIDRVLSIRDGGANLGRVVSIGIDLQMRNLMNVKRPFSATITIGDQPTEADLKQLKQEGYGAIVNLRNDGEPEQPLSTSEEGAIVRELGMDYLHYGVGAAPLTASGVNAVADFIDQHAQGPDKVLVHCRKGGRVVALLLLQQARANKWNADEVIARGKAIGLEVEGGLKTMVEAYLRAQG